MRPFETDVSSRYGAPMGRRSEKLSGRVHLNRVPLYGDYDAGGAYWGGGRGTLPLFCAWNDEGQQFVRALDRTHAKLLLPDCTFYR